jgi:hypothetical protein
MQIELTRRDAAWLIARAAVTPLFASWLQAASHTNAHTHAPADPHDWSNYAPRFFSPDEFAALKAFAEILIPSDDTPGAKEAYVAAFVDFVVNAAAEYAPEMQERWKQAVDWLVSQNFGRLSFDKQLALIRKMAEPEEHTTLEHPGFATYRLIKDMTIHAFYTSRVGLVDVLEYKGLAYLSEFPACNHPEHRRV